MLVHRMILILAIVVLLIAPSDIVRADDKQDQENVYEVFRDLEQATANLSVDEQTTVRIKRYMANLLYPVNLSAFDRPEKDHPFLDLIKLLQKQMGVPITGVLTLKQFNTLADASDHINDRHVGVPFKQVGAAADGSWASAVGTAEGISEPLADPINIARFMCIKASKTCILVSASLQRTHGQFLWVDHPDVYDVQSWSDRRIVAIAQQPCGFSLMTMDIIAKKVTVSIFCNERPITWKLVEGIPLAWKLHQDRVNKARALVYEPAKRFIPTVQAVE
jgi:hypothetical protein